MRIDRPLLLCLILAAIALILNAITPAKRARLVDPVDSSRVDTIKQVIRVQDSSARRSLDSLREVVRKRPIREVVRTLPGQRDTLRDTIPGPVVEVPEQVVRETADSLAQCRFDRDSTARQVTLWQARTASQEEARRLCESKPALIQPDPPSRLTWAAIGATGIAAITATLLILTR